MHWNHFKWFSNDFFENKISLGLRSKMKKISSWVILKSVTSCTPNRISTDIHGKYVIIYVCVAGNTALKRRALIKEKVKEKARFRMNLTSIYLASQNMHLRFRFAVQRTNSISSWFSWSFSIFQLINWVFSQVACGFNIIHVHHM